MGNFANTLFSSLLGWLRGAAAWLWSFLNNPDSGGFIVWVADNWLTLVILLCAACMLIDFIVYMFRWQPYKVWASFFRRLFGRDTSNQHEGRIRRRWIHADGTMSFEEVDPDEMMPEPEPEPQRLFAPPVEEEPIAARYARFARPQAPVESESVEQPQAYEFPAEEPAARPERPISRLRRFAQTNDEELPLRYTAPSTSEDAPAYHEPYYPPQWRRPSDTGASGVDAGGSGA